MVTIESLEEGLKERFKYIDDIAFYNQKKVLDAFIDCKVSSQCFIGTTGYGYDDVGRDTLGRVYAKVFHSDKAIVTPLITCGTHAITTVMFGLLRAGDLLMSATGSLYDTIHDTIFGHDGSLETYGIKYGEVPLLNGEIDVENLVKAVKEQKPKVVFFQRSRGYSSRKAFSCDVFEKVFKKVREVLPEDSFIAVDNCYGEFVEKREPTDVGADVVVGSLIKNPGGGLAPSGGYIVGSEKAIERIATRFTSPSLMLEVGSYESGYRLFYQGLFLAPHVVAQAVKGAYLIGEVMKSKGYKVLPDSSEPTFDIIKSVVFSTEEELIKFVQMVQAISPVDSYVLPLPWDMPGYEDKVIMSAGTFVGGASIELSCDSPIKKPYIAYFQGGLTYEHIKILADKLLHEFN